MLMKTEKILEYVNQIPFEDIRNAWIARCRVENERLSSLDTDMATEGFERVDDTGFVTPDGREILHIGKRTYALRPEVHASRLKHKFSVAAVQTKKRDENPAAVNEEKDVFGTEALAPIACPHCGDSMESTRLCPACEASKLGYAYKYRCACGRSEFIAKTKIW